MKLTTQLLLVPRLRMSGAIRLLRLYAFVAWTGTNLAFYLNVFAVSVTEYLYVFYKIHV